MQGVELLHIFLKKSLPFIHTKRVTALKEVVASLLIGKRLTLTGLARSMQGKAKERHQIRKMDRLLGNKHLHNEQTDIYQAINLWLINSKQPIINVDWSCVSKRKDWHILRASLVIKGREHPIYQEVHPISSENSPHVQKSFLKRLKKILPKDVRAIIVTDAGFRGPWFKEVEKQGFDWIGRIRNKTCYRIQGNNSWQYTYDLYQEAGINPKIIQKVALSKSNALKCTLVLFKKARRGRTHINLSGYKTNNNASNRCAKREREPWLLATSLSVEDKQAAKKIISYYEKRMQIEEDFRDTKSHRFGFGLRYSLSNHPKRLELLLLIGVLALFVCWITTLAAVKKNLHWDYQSNTIKKRTVLSITYLACQLIRKRVFLKKKELLEAAVDLRTMVGGAYLC